MRINKYNKPKDVSGNRLGTTTVINNVVGGNASSNVADRLSEMHTIFGQPFNGTQDVSGDIKDAKNITATGGDLKVKKEGGEGGNIYADGNITSNGNVTGDKFIGDVDADDVSTNTLSADSGTITSLSGTSLNFDSGELREAIIDALQSTEITTEKLTVTKQAHFFELLIDKIKAAGGAIILSPADGFKVEKIINESNQYRLLWKATDGEKKIRNMWKVNDQALCQTFNTATGTSYYAYNKFYWALVVSVGRQAIDGQDYNYIGISTSDYDGTLNPEVGDEIAMLGYRGTDDASRQSAIYISSYNSIDATIKAPLFCHYKGINNFNLSTHKYTWFASNGNQIRGNLLIESGQAVEDLVNALTITSTSIEYAKGTSATTPPSSGWQTSVPIVSSNEYLWTRTTVNYSDGTSTISYSVGKIGNDAEFYKLMPQVRKAIVTKEDVLSITLSYSIAHIKGSDVSYVNASADGYHVIFQAQGILTTYSLSYGSLCNYTNTSFLSDYSQSQYNPQFLMVQLLDANGDVCDQDYIPIAFDASATLQITDQIVATVQGNTNAISGLQGEVQTNTNSISTITQQYNSISSTVQSHTSAINALSGQVATNSTDISNITQTADQISLRVEKVENISGTNLLLSTNKGGTNWYISGATQAYQQYPFTISQSTEDILTNKYGEGIQFVRTSNYPASAFISTLREVIGYSVRPEKIISGKKYTISFKARFTFEAGRIAFPTVNGVTNYNIARLKVKIDNQNGSNPITEEAITDYFEPRAAHTISATFQATKSGTIEDADMIVYIVPDGIKHLWKDVKIWDIKLEEGEVATEWCAAPEDYTDYDSETASKVAELQIRADQISARVDEVALTITDQKIILDGETEVNGTVNVNRDGTGFRLNGSNGESFTIGSNDIGTYSNFVSQTVHNWWHIFNQCIANFSGSDVIVKVSSLCTTLQSGQRLRITNLYLKTTDYSFANSSVRSATINIYKGSVMPDNKVALATVNNPSASNGYWYQGTSSMTGNNAALIDYTADANGEYYIEIVATLSGTANGYTYLDAWAACEISLNAFGSLTYNGFGFNFGGGKVAFIGSDSMIFKMGSDAAIRLTTANGLQRLVAESYRYPSATIMHTYANSGQWIGYNDYVVRVVQDLSSTSMRATIDFVSPRDEMLVVKSTSYPIIMLLPTAATCVGKSYIIKNYSSLDTVYVGVGSLTTTNTAGNIISAGGNTGYNESCAITTSGSTTTYRQLMKCSKNPHQLISDGTKWIDCLLV